MGSVFVPLKLTTLLARINKLWNGRPQICQGSNGLHLDGVVLFQETGRVNNSAHVSEPPGLVMAAAGAVCRDPPRGLDWTYYNAFECHST